MSALNPNPSGFSYAQAAKGRTPPSTQASPRNPSSAAAIPLPSQPSEPAAGSNWADAVEDAVVSIKSTDVSNPLKSITQVNGVGAELEKSVEQRDLSNLSSEAPGSEVVADGPNRTLDEKETLPSTDSTIVPEVTPVNNSASSEPAWIAERKERQSSSQSSDTNKADKVSQEGSPSPPATKLQDAPPPPVNPWMKRMEDSRSKVTAQLPVPTSASQNHVNPEGEPSKENQKPNNDQKRKAATVVVPVRTEDSKKPNEAANKKQAETRLSRHSGTEGNSSSMSTSQSRAGPPSSLPPSVKDETSWPTPNTVLDKERKDVVSKEQASKHIDETTASSKLRKPEWKNMPVTPNYLFETQNIRGRDAPRGGDRGSRGGLRSRNGGTRGGINGSAGDRNNRGKDDESATQRGRQGIANRETSSVTGRAASANSWNDQNKEIRQEHSIRGQSVTEPRPSKRIMGGAESSMIPVSEFKKAKPQKLVAEVNGTQDPFLESKQHQSSAGTQSDEAAIHTALPPHSASPGNRKDARIENARDASFTAPSRANRRGGRGRGGNAREHVNGHAAGHSSDHAAAAATSTTPLSPGVHPTHARGSQQGGFGQQGRGGWSRGSNPRSQSIPFDPYYGRFTTPYAQLAQLPPVQTYMPGMYEYPTYPMTAVPYQPFMDQQYLMEMVSTQLEYYFSIDNLLKDVFLRKNMDSQGFVLLEVIAGFNRIKQLTQDKDLLKAVCINSEHIEIRVGEDKKDRLRRRDGWDQFLLPLDQRDPGAQHEGPKELQIPERPPFHIEGPSPYRGPSSAIPQLQQRGDRRSYDASLAMMNGFQHQEGVQGSYAEIIPGLAERGRSAKSQDKVAKKTSTSDARDEEKDLENDAFPDDQASTLIVVVKVNKPQRAPYHSAASRTFSNGSIDSRSILSEVAKKPAEGPVTNGETTTHTPESNASPHRKMALASDVDLSLFWMKDQSLPSEGLPTDVTSEPYEALRVKALEQRSQAATGTCPYDMDVLYQFWCHFLIRNFNSRMYGEFKHFANEDAKDRRNLSGLHSLVRFYAQALLSHTATRERLVRDYVQLVKAEPAELGHAAFKQLRSAWRNGALNLKNRKKLNDIVDTELRERLES